ncbi:MAG: hypothetical protein U5L03_00090 [Burkholderiaceae bacterium]|nr:hypothetical protein [Burkholderiaceae bacterium]
MNRSILAPALAAALLAAPVAHATDVGVSIEISQPGVYGRIDIGRYPQPALVLPQPVIILPPRAVAPPPPVYVWVPYGHRKDWKKHCHRYNACGVPVYFVRHDWYDDNVRYGDDRGGKGKGKGQGKDQGKGRD